MLKAVERYGLTYVAPRGFFQAEPDIHKAVTALRGYRQRRFE